MIDSHCHTQFNSFQDDYEEVIKRCAEKNCAMFVVGTQKDTSVKAVELAQKYDNIYAIVGLHPIHCNSTEIDEEETRFVSREEEFDYKYYKDLAQKKKVIGIGECGLDLYHIPEDKDKDEILLKQKKVFLQQIKLAQELNLPLSIHIRDAYEEVLNFIADEIITLQSRKDRIKGVIHCYSSNWKNAKQFLDLGFYLGFTGVVTFPARKTNPQPTIDLMEVIKKCPVNKMLVETDAPYLAPQKYRGQRCEPWMVEEVIKKIAEIKELSENEVKNIIQDNTVNLFYKIS